MSIKQSDINHLIDLYNKKRIPIDGSPALAAFAKRNAHLVETCKSKGQFCWKLTEKGRATARSFACVKSAPTKRTTKKRTTKKRTTKKRTTKKRATKKRATKKRATKKRTTKKRTTKKRATKKRATKKRATKKRSPRQGQLF